MPSGRKGDPEMSTSGINSLLSALNPSTTETLSQLLGQSNSSTNTGTSTAIQQAVNAILNSATGTSGTGIDVTSTVDAILQIDAAPETNLQSQVTAFNAQTAALKTIESDLAALQTSVQALSDPVGAFSSVAVTSSNNNVVSATAANGTTAGSHSIVVGSLATTAAQYSKSQLLGTTVIPSGSFDLQVGSTGPVETIPIDSTDGTNTLSGLATYINQMDLGVTASVITDTSGARLSLVSQTSGAAGALTITNDTTGTTGLGFTQATDGNGHVLGADAQLTVDGIPVSSSTNTVTGAIPGVTLILSGASTSPVTIDVQPDYTQVGTAVNNFVTAYNQVITDINAQYSVDSSAGSVPPLLGDSSLERLQSQLLNGITTSIAGNNGLVNLQSIGIQLQTDGTLKVASSSSPDSMSLNDALIQNFSAVQNLFQSPASSVAGAGVAQALNTSLISLTDAVNGPLNLDMTGINNNVTDLNKQISDFQYQLQQTQTQLMNEYSLINTMLEQLPQTLAAVNSQLDSLNPTKQ
jgi:flagellar hook-associated protein 2